MMGEDIPELVDHINRDPSDNRWVNLRPADKSINAINAKRRPSKSGHIGVCWWEERGKWVARARRHNVSRTIGYYKTLAEAVEARADYVRAYDHPC
jgi:hypothetical protein